MTPYLIAAAVLLVPVLAIVSYGLLLYRLELSTTYSLARLSASLSTRKSR